MVKIVVGDLLNAAEDIIVQQVNCRSAMGSGLAKAIYTRWPEVKTEYHEFCRKSTPFDLLGKVQFIPVVPNKIIANVFGQLDYGRTAGKTFTNMENTHCGTEMAEDLQSSVLSRMVKTSAMRSPGLKPCLWCTTHQKSSSVTPALPIPY